jgi:hypothetical protein
VHDSNTLEEGYYRGYTLDVPQSYLWINFSSDKPASVLLFDESEYAKFSSGENESSFYIEGEENTTKWSLERYAIERGTYYIVVGNFVSTSTINYNISTSYKLTIEDELNESDYSYTE